VGGTVVDAYRGLPVSLVAELYARYEEPWRRYHDRRHLVAVLAYVDELAGLAGDADAVRMAAWFHDAVYDPGRQDNEAASADLAQELLPAHDVAADQVAEVVRLVRLTAAHDPVDGDANGAVLCDADLAVLGGDPAAYQAYVDRVREEHRGLDDATFAAGRAPVLEALLAQPQLFRTATARERWDAPARRNLAAEIGDLAARLGGAPGTLRDPAASGGEDRRR
jgi:predicted metal-dependent HD superfamily phosphohydrolase